MERLTSPRTIKYIMEKYGFRFSKGLGQNFIIDENVLTRIIEGSEVTKNDMILEIGPGIGVLTDVLCENASKVVSVEIDKSLIPVLTETVGHHENLKVINSDVLKIDVKALIAEEFGDVKPKLVANLPYYVTTPIIMMFLEERIPISDLVVMIQKEVADRIVAKPSTKAYGALSVVVQYFTEPSIVTRVSRGSFMPMPNVDSTVIRLKVRDVSPVQLEDEAIFFLTIKDAFGKRRKTLLNALSSGFLKISKDQAREALEIAAINENTRGEALDINTFATLANAIYKVRNKEEK
ncbi:16S rRNA (adenine(1518)-N(6)/adenine(1519)-N(6))-dimethyltransferase RsmA [Fusibacter bizertensis]|uniref:Ribosomal RNA small subunit methyltransferase A n=1 Tax=Fusibacter bizertensis TaxID=1488331 RepID=A0ABT6NDH6_9FIRM|nr:16S rRNA (adenine(1518)-N(6)/adenine(1519)-N(6))-dimethyltransferase RsmA [Fusibacter bizertensis]MDH8678474.1 16S rRNA (adenine(1518)-N(6)/adenine(1519)-N(6))-dimethyltransferase RsmA [Fusibacter bizertensis]